MNNNYRANQIAIKQFRKELSAMMDDIGNIDRHVLSVAVNVGLADVKRNTPVGNYSKSTFVDPDADNKFNTKEITVGIYRHTIKVGGFMRKSWSSPRVKRVGRGVEKGLFNSAGYSSFVNDGHRIVKNGVNIGFVKGKFMLEKAIHKVNKVMESEFKKEVERVNKEHDK
jgi:hypothetical protein